LTCPSGRPLPFVRLSLRGYTVADAGDGEGGRERGEGERDEGEGEGDSRDEGLGDVLASSGDKYCDLSIGERCAIEGFDLVGGEEYVLCAERLGDEDEDEGEFVLDFLADGELEPIEI
jgi:hypothetical protein